MSLTCHHLSPLLDVNRVAITRPCPSTTTTTTSISTIAAASLTPYSMFGARVEAGGPMLHRSPALMDIVGDVDSFAIQPMFPMTTSGLDVALAALTPSAALPLGLSLCNAAGDDDDCGGSSKRSILKWEADEVLGVNATISAVLYVNTIFPDLRREYPGTGCFVLYDLILCFLFYMFV